MNIQRLRYAREIARQNLNLTAAAAALHTSQPGVSKQIIELEEEIGAAIFVRKGKRLAGITEVGERVLRSAERILAELDDLERVTEQFEQDDVGTLTIATTHTQVRYALPPVLSAFRERFPRVSIRIRQGTPKQIARWVDEAEADVGLATEALAKYDDLSVSSWYEWRHCVIVPKTSPWAKLPLAQLSQLARMPLISYDEAFTGRAAIDKAFVDAELRPEIVLAALDSDVIKTYVRFHMGVGIIAEVAIDKKQDSDLKIIPVGHLFGRHTVKVALKQNRVQRAYVNTLIEMLQASPPVKVKA